MQTKISSYPYPERNPLYLDKDIYFIKDRKDCNYINNFFRKNTSVESISIANQFFSIERVLLEAFQYVLPIERNAKTCSAKFATIIRESCNLYEVIARDLYFKFFKINKSSHLDIYNFLSLDKFLKLSNEELRAPTLNSYHQNESRIEPFFSLKSWNMEELIKQEHVPFWWKDYNKIKHNIGSGHIHATLENAIYSLSGLFLLIRKVHGDGLVSGFLTNCETQNEHLFHYPIKNSDIFIGEIFKSQRS